MVVSLVQWYFEGEYVVLFTTTTGAGSLAVSGASVVWGGWRGLRVRVALGCVSGARGGAVGCV